MEKKTDPRKAIESTADFLDLKAHQTGDIKHFLKKYFLFRAYVVFKTGKKFHPYGNEHMVTYNQLRYGKVDSIILNREKGYTDLIGMIEKNYAGKISTAKIYCRNPGENNFDTLCRYYDNTGQLVECQDPVIPDDQKILTLYYYTHKGLVIVTETNPAGENFNINL